MDPPWADGWPSWWFEDDQKEQSMNAAELYEIVKDVPEDIHPDAYFDPYTGRWHATETDRPITTTLAEAAFVGSMVAWLLDRDIFLAKSSVSGTYYAVDTKSLDHRFGNYKTIIAALAAACKEARP